MSRMWWRRGRGGALCAIMGEDSERAHSKPSCKQWQWQNEGKGGNQENKRRATQKSECGDTHAMEGVQQDNSANINNKNYDGAQTGTQYSTSINRDRSWEGSWDKESESGQLETSRAGWNSVWVL